MARPSPRPTCSGTGPFVVTEREQGIRLELERFADYWDKDSPGNVDEIVFTPIKEPATRVAALLAGDVDFIAPVPPTDLKRIEQASCCTLITMPRTRVLTFELNQDRVAAFKDPRVRMAMSYAINREGIAKKIMRGLRHRRGPAQPARLCRPRSRAGSALRPRQGQGVDEGGGLRGRLLGDHDRARTTAMSGDARIAEAVAAMLAKINIKVDLQTMPKAQYWQRFDARDGDILMIGWQSDTQELGEFLRVPGDDARPGDGLRPIQCRAIIQTPRSTG